MPESQGPLSDRGWDDFLETYAEEIRSAAARACPRDAGVAADELAQEIRLRSGASGRERRSLCA